MEHMNFFLRDVWNQSKIVFTFFVAFILSTVWCTFSKMEITPFFLWAHYSDRQVSTGKYDRIYINVNGNILDLPKLTRPTREMIQLPTEYFVHLEEYSYQTSTRHVLRKHVKSLCSETFYAKIENRLVNNASDKDEYLNWLKRYIERVYEIDVHELEVGSCKLVIHKDDSVERINLKSIAKLTKE